MDSVLNDITLLLPLLPILAIGILSGCFSWMNSECSSWKCALKIVATSSFLSVMAFSILSATDLPYLAKIGVSAGVGYFGLEKAIELIQRILNFRNNSGASDPPRGKKGQPR